MLSNPFKIGMISFILLICASGLNCAKRIEYRNLDAMSCEEIKEVLIQCLEKGESLRNDLEDCLSRN